MVIPGLFINGSTPKLAWFTMENAISMDDDWGYPYFMKPSYDPITNEVPLLKTGALNMELKNVVCILFHVSSMLFFRTVKMGNS